ncbi:uncharacterized protein [Enoplosus armatus]|uniref:uncharacterized protein n=1 Tax=Enoplosus armatus TaxID=215367 RepID=UPI0039943FB1
MDKFENRLTEQVRLYRHLYDPSSRDHRDTQMVVNSWKEIATTLEKEEAFCRKAWKNMRDRFVKAKKKTRGRRVNKAAPPILEELEWLTQFVKHREADNNFDVEDDGAGFNSKDQKTPLKFCTPDVTSVDPPISSSAAGSLSPSPHSPAEPSLSGPPSEEMTYSSYSSSPSVNSSPHPDPSSSPLILLTSVATQSTHPDLLSPVSRKVTPPSPSTSPCTSAQKNRRTVDDAILTRLAHLDQERQTFRQQDNEDFRFAAVIVDMLAGVNPEHKPEVKFKIYQMLFEAAKRS